MRRNKLSQISVGAGALDSPLEGARFELSRAHVENIMWITQMRLQSIRRGVRDAEGVVPYRAVGKFSWLLSHVVIVACSFDGRTMFAPTIRYADNNKVQNAIEYIKYQKG